MGWFDDIGLDLYFSEVPTTTTLGEFQLNEFNDYVQGALPDLYSFDFGGDPYGGEDLGGEPYGGSVYVDPFTYPGGADGEPNFELAMSLGDRVAVEEASRAAEALARASGVSLNDLTIINKDGQVVYNRLGQPMNKPGQLLVRMPDGTIMTKEQEGMLGGWLAPFNNFLATPTGGILATLGIGGIGMGVAALAAGEPPKIEFPQPTRSPVQQAGQRATMEALLGKPLSFASATTGTLPPAQAAIRQQLVNGQVTREQAIQALANQTDDPGGLVDGWLRGEGAPRAVTGQDLLTATVGQGLAGQAELTKLASDAIARERAYDAEEAPVKTFARSLALSNVPGYLMEPEPADVITPAIQNRIMRAIEGREVDPTLERQLAEQKQMLLNKLAKMYGRPGQETEGTVGGALAQDFDKRAGELRYLVNKDILGTLLPHEQTRRSFAAGQRQQRLGENVALSAFGRVSPTQLGTSLSTMVPIRPLLGIDDANERAVENQLRVQAAVGQYQAETAADQARSQAIGRIFGEAAGAVTRPRNTFAGGNPVMALVDTTGVR